MSIEKIDENILVIQQQEARIRELEQALNVIMANLGEAGRHIIWAQFTVGKYSKDKFVE